ncbi:MAG: aminotransferase class IV [Phycisphaerae bacterium]|nr:aminotransferase class IV [Phycisphaerae bacterium]
MKEVAYVNGEFHDLREAKISIEDRGFQFADGVYEVIVAPHRQPFHLQQHLERLKKSTEAIDLPVDYDALDLPAVIREGLQRCDFEDSMIYLQITRGVVPRDHLYPDATTPTVVATFKAKPVYDPKLRKRGVHIETARDIRWEHCHIKSIALLANVMMKNAARQRGRFDAIILGADHTVRETTCANVFLLNHGVLRTPPADQHILHGVTRLYILECARDLQIPCEETYFKTADLLAADEVFISSTTIDIMPVAAIDDHPIGSGAMGELTLRLLERFYRGMCPVKS